MVLLDIVAIAVILVIIAWAYGRSKEIMEQIATRGDELPKLKKDYLEARQRFLNAVNEMDTRLKKEIENKIQAGAGQVAAKEITTYSLKQMLDIPAAKETDVALKAYKAKLVDQAQDYENLILPLIPVAAFLLIVIGVVLNRYNFGWIFWTTFWIALMGPVAYAALSLRNVPKAHIGAKYIFENYLLQVGPGLTIVWLGIGSLVTMPTKSLYFNPEMDDITIPGKESQKIAFDPAIVYRAKDIFSIVENVGESSIGAVEEFVNRVLITEIASVARYIITRGLFTADDVLSMGPKIAGAIDDRIEVDLGFLGIDFDPSQISVDLTDQMIKARQDRSESEIAIVTAQNKRKQEFERLMVNIDVMRQLTTAGKDGELPISDPRTTSLIALLLLGKDGIAAFGGKLNFNMIQGMEDLMSGLKGMGGGGKVPPGPVMQENALLLLDKINKMDKKKLDELLKGVDMIVSGGGE